MMAFFLYTFPFKSSDVPVCFSTFSTAVGACVWDGSTCFDGSMKQIAAKNKMSMIILT